jgi:L,D-transpeptidase catalytic domain
MATRAHTQVLRRAALASLVLTYTLAAAGRAAAADAAPKAPRTRPVRRIVVSIPDCKLALLENDRVVRVYSVAVGAETSPTPIGTFTIVNRITNPTYYRPGMVIPPGDANPLGTRWLGLNAKGFGIHGTDAPSSIGHPRSHGCIRMRNGDVEELFERLRPGDLVELRGDPFGSMAHEIAQGVAQLFVG